MNKSCTTTFCRLGCGLKENDISFYICRITIPAFYAGDSKGVTTKQDCIYKFNMLISPYKIMVFQNQNK